MPQTYTALTSSMTEGFTSIGTQMTALIGDVAPIAIGIMGGFLVVKAGIRFFKGTAKG